MAVVKRIFLLLCTVAVCCNAVSEEKGQAADYGTAAKDISDISLYTVSGQEGLPRQPAGERVDNVILLIGDGMGVNQLTLARLAAAGKQGRLHIEQMPVTGLVRIHSADSIVPDSPAAATAMACGVKTNNGMIGMDTDGRAYKSIMLAAQDKGFRTGIVVTSTVSDATPAAFAAHVRSRDEQEQIAAQLLDSRIGLIFGGGAKYWLPEPAAIGRDDTGRPGEAAYANTGCRKDRRNLIELAKYMGYRFITGKEQLLDAAGGPVIGLFNSDRLSTFAPEPTLEQMTRTAIRLLHKKNPEWFAPEPRFFLLIEGSQIDTACHDKDTDNCIRQVLLFDQAARAALEFAARDRRTLVIVTADHETGGLSLYKASSSKTGRPAEARWDTGDHTAAMVPIFAYGPGAANFGGVYDNTDIPAKIARLIGIKKFPQPLEQPKDPITISGQLPAR